jgi:hypothetical protein
MMMDLIGDWLRHPITIGVLIVILSLLLFQWGL